MAKPVANVIVAADSFASWVARTNQLADAMSLYAVTVDSTANGANVSGNGFVIGILQANTLAAGDALRGGSVSASANLNITSNTRFTGAVVYSTANLNIDVANAYINSTITYIVGGLANVTSNVSVVTTNTSISAANTSLKGGNVHVTSNTQINAANVVINATNTVISGTRLNITSNTDLVAAILNANAVVTVNGNTTVTANSIVLKANSSLSTISISGNGTVSNTTISGNTFTVVGNAFFSNTISVTGAATLSNTVSVGNTITVTGNATFSNTGSFAGLLTVATANVTSMANIATANVGTLNVTGNSNLAGTLYVGANTTLNGNVQFQNNYTVVVTSNTNIGTNTSVSQLVFALPKTSFSSAKITAQIKGTTGNTQINEIVMAHDGTTPFLTVYGTVSSPLNSNLGVFSTALNSSDIELKFLQSAANSSVIVVAHLIK